MEINIIITNMLNDFKDENNKYLFHKLWINIYKIMYKFPPKKNENKFVYGKLIEIEINNLLSLLYEESDIIDDAYLYDLESVINSQRIKFSIKASKNKNNNIVIVNKNSNNKNYMLNLESDFKNIVIIIVQIETASIYIINYDTFKHFLKETGHNIYISSRIFNYLNSFKHSLNVKEHDEIKIKTSKILPLNYYHSLYKEHIQNDF